jgi:hypothetical protein
MCYLIEPIPVTIANMPPKTGYADYNRKKYNCGENYPSANNLFALTRSDQFIPDSVIDKKPEINREHKQQWPKFLPLKMRKKTTPLT